MAITVGDKAPLFTLFETRDHTISLQDYAAKKNVLLLFFPLAFTSTCTKELCCVRDDIGKYNNESTEVIGISVDSVYTLKKYKEEQHFNYSLISDFNREVSEKYETIYDSFTPMGMKGVSKRSAFIIDKKGIVQYAEVLDNAGEIPDFAQIDKILAELQ
ncbi:MAG: redoxin domain-containing protein [Ferruginibacter sp.]